MNIIEHSRANNTQVSLPPSQFILQSHPRPPTTPPQQSIAQPKHLNTQPKQSIAQTQHPIVLPPQPLDPETGAFYPPNQSNPNQESMKPYINFIARSFTVKSYKS